MRTLQKKISDYQAGGRVLRTTADSIAEEVHGVPQEEPREPT